MSKERELLREIMGYIASGVVSITSNDLGDAAETLHEIKELLAQPEQESVYQKLSRIEDGIEVEILPSELWQDGYETGKRSALLSKQPEQSEYIKTKKEIEIYFVKDEFGSLRPTFKNPKETPFWIDVLHGGL